MDSRVRSMPPREPQVERALHPAARPLLQVHWRAAWSIDEYAASTLRYSSATDGDSTAYSNPHTPSAIAALRTVTAQPIPTLTHLHPNLALALAPSPSPSTSTSPSHPHPHPRSPSTTTSHPLTANPTPTSHPHPAHPHPHPHRAGTSTLRGRMAYLLTYLLTYLGTSTLRGRMARH